MVTLNHVLKANENKSPITILLVVSEYCFNIRHINDLLESYKTLLNIFPNFEEINPGLGLIISMADPDATA